MTNDHPPIIQSSADEVWSARLFRDLPKGTIAAVLARSRVREYGRGDFVFLAGDRAETVNLLLAGHVKVVRETEDGQEVILRLIQPGDIFGGAGAWGAEVYPATAVALEAARALQLPAADFARLIESQPAFAMAVVRELGTRLREAETRIQELQAERVERRLARALLRLAKKTGRRTAEGIEIPLPLSRQHLAELAGTTLSTASRAMSEWDRRGLIRAGREQVTILRPHDLVVVAEDLAGPEHD